GTDRTGSGLTGLRSQRVLKGPCSAGDAYALLRAIRASPGTSKSCLLFTLRCGPLISEEAGGRIMQRELSYQVPFERLSRLGRSAGRKAYATLWWSIWLFVALVLAALIGLVVYGDALVR